MYCTDRVDRNKEILYTFHFLERVETRTRQFRSHWNRTSRSPSSYTETERWPQVHACRFSTKKSINRFDLIVEHWKTFQCRTTATIRKLVSSNQLSRIPRHPITSTVSRMGPFLPVGRGILYRSRSLVIWWSRTGHGRRKPTIQLSQGKLYRWCGSFLLCIIPCKFNIRCLDILKPVHKNRSIQNIFIKKMAVMIDLFVNNFNKTWMIQWTD